MTASVVALVSISVVGIAERRGGRAEGGGESLRLVGGKRENVGLRLRLRWLMVERESVVVVAKAAIVMCLKQDQPTVGELEM